MNPDLLRPRVGSETCVRCRKTFSPGDRVQIVNIVDKVARNQSTRMIGAWIRDEYEMSHVDCRDPALVGTVIIA